MSRLPTGWVNTSRIQELLLIYERSWTLKPRDFQLSRLQRFHILPKYCIISINETSVFLFSWKSFKCFSLQHVDSIQSPFIQSIPLIFPIGFLYCWLLHLISSLLWSVYCFLINFWVVVLGLCCCTQAFSSCSNWRLVSLVVHGLLTAVAFPVVKRRL